MYGPSAKAGKEFENMKPAAAADAAAACCQQKRKKATENSTRCFARLCGGGELFYIA